MPDPVTRAQASSGARLRYLEAALETEEGLEEVIRILTARKAITPNPSESALIRAKLLEHQAELQKVRAELTAYTAGYGTFRPPSSRDVEEIHSVVEKLDVVVADSVETNNVLALAHNLLGLWSKTRPNHA